MVSPDLRLLPCYSIIQYWWPHTTLRCSTMSPPPSGPQLSFLPSFACSAVAACIAEAATLPLDTAKVRLQMQGGLLKPGEAPKYRHVSVLKSQAPSMAPPSPCRVPKLRLTLPPLCRGLLGTVRVVAREEGVGALWKGLEPGAFAAPVAPLALSLGAVPWRRYPANHVAQPQLMRPLRMTGLHRQCLFGGLRIGLYDHVKKLFVGKDHVGDVNLLHKIAAGLVTGALCGRRAG